MSHAAGCLSLVEVIWLVDDNACVTNADFGYASKSNRIKLIDFFRTRLLSTYNICNWNLSILNYKGITRHHFPNLWIPWSSFSESFPKLNRLGWESSSRRIGPFCPVNHWFEIGKPRINKYAYSLIRFLTSDWVKYQILHGFLTFRQSTTTMEFYIKDVIRKSQKSICWRKQKMPHVYFSTSENFPM